MPHREHLVPFMRAKQKRENPKVCNLLLFSREIMIYIIQAHICINCESSFMSGITRY